MMRNTYMALQKKYIYIHMYWDACMCTYRCKIWFSLPFTGYSHRFPREINYNISWT